MGDRAQIHIVHPSYGHDIWLYTHWGASKLCGTLMDAMLAGHPRWKDPEYLTRIIFSRMVENDVRGELGYGIGNAKHGDIWRYIEVDCAKQIVADFVLDCDEIAEEWRCVGRWTFEEFVDEPKQA